MNNTCNLQYLATVALKAHIIKREVEIVNLARFIRYKLVRARYICGIIVMHLSGGLSSKLIIPPCVRPCVGLSPSSEKLKTYAFAPYCLKFQKSLM